MTHKRKCSLSATVSLRPVSLTRSVISGSYPYRLTFSGEFDADSIDSAGAFMQSLKDLVEHWVPVQERGDPTAEGES